MIWTILASSLILCLGGSSYAIPYDRGPCEQLLERKEWYGINTVESRMTNPYRRALNVEEKKSYIRAVKCLQSRPAHNISRPVSWTRFDEFQFHHIDLTLIVHRNAKFLPWHRLFVKSYEIALRDECGYQGAQPYWNWSIDADSPNFISKSPIWDPDTGFGGDGVPGTYVLPADPTNSIIMKQSYHGCVQDGPFVDYKLRLGPGLVATEHCLTRGFNDTIGVFLNSSAVAETLASRTFDKFRVVIEGFLDPPVYEQHLAGHFVVGGDMSNPFSSPGDPIFYLHHANLDRLWWIWQNANPERLYDISGPTSFAPPFVNITLSYPLQMRNIGTTLPVGDVMDIENKPSCYTYA